MPPFYSVRPLGLRQSILALEVQGRAQGDESDVREQFTLWDPQGQPHRAYPEILIERAMTGRELLALQEQAWAEHVRQVRSLFGAVPMAGVGGGATRRGLLAFRIPYFSDRGRWTLIYREQSRWHFSPTALREGLAWPIEPVGNGVTPDRF